MSFWMRKQSRFNQGFKGRPILAVALLERGQLIAMFDVMFGVSPFWRDCLEAFLLHAALPVSLLISQGDRRTDSTNTHRQILTNFLKFLILHSSLSTHWLSVSQQWNLSVLLITLWINNIWACRWMELSAYDPSCKIWIPTGPKVFAEPSHNFCKA